MVPQRNLETCDRRPEIDFEAEAKNLAQSAIDSFERVMHELSEIRSAHQGISGSLSEFSGLVAEGDDASRKLEQVQSDIEAMQGALEQYSSLVQNPQSNTLMHEGRSYLSKIGLHGKTLAAIATLTRTTVASLGITTLDRYLDGLKSTAEEIQKASAQVTDHLTDLRERSRGAALECGTAKDALEALPAVFDEGLEILDRLAQGELRLSKELSQNANDLADRGRSHLKGFVAAMQFSDRLAQRLDHVSYMMGLEDAHVTRLAAAQIGACVEDIRDVATDVRNTMSAIAEMGHRGATLFSEPQITDAIGETLHARSDLVARVMCELNRVEPAMENVRGNAQDATEKARSAGVSFDDLANSANDLALAAVNSLLLATRSGDAARPLVVLSAEVRTTAADCLSDVGQGRSRLARLIEGQSGAATALISSSEQLQRSVADYDGQTRSGQARLEKINRLKAQAGGNAEALVFMVDAVSEAMDAMDAVAESLADLSKELLAFGAEGEVDAELLSTVFAIYTMDEEREVHRVTFPECMPQENPPDEPENTGDDLDDIFF